MIHRIFSPVASGDPHLLHRDLGISMGSLVAVEPSGKRLPSRLKNPEALLGRALIQGFEGLKINI